MITYQQERLKDMFKEWVKIIPYHWDEICTFDKDKTVLNPDWDTYFAYDSIEKFFMFTCRKEGELIGYYTSFIVPHTHYKDRIVSQSDNIFILKEHRKGFIGVKLIKNAEERLKELGVDIVTLRVKSDGRLHGIMERLKYNPLDTTYFKEF